MSFIIFIVHHLKPLPVENKYLHAQTTSVILSAYFKVYNTLGCGFLEKVYQHAMCIEFRKRGIPCIPSTNVCVYYEGEEVGHYVTDIIVDNVVIVELKAAEGLREEHEAQLTNYLKATDIEVGLLLNFGKHPEYKRKIFSKEYKNHRNG
ncbi:MAG: GxxExxY protein [Saprospiraceae bacterium]